MNGAGGSIRDGIPDAALTPRLIQPTTFGKLDRTLPKKRLYCGFGGRVVGLSALFAGLIFKTFHPQKQEEKAT